MRCPVTSGSRTLRDAINEAMRDWMASVESTHYILGSVVGPHPFPLIVRDFQSVIGREARRQCQEQLGRLPELVVACVGGGSNAAGIFYPFIEDESVALVGVEAGGLSPQPGDHAAPLCFGEPGVLHGSYSYVMQDDDGQTHFEAFGAELRRGSLQRRFHILLFKAGDGAAQGKVTDHLSGPLRIAELQRA